MNGMLCRLVGLVLVFTSALTGASAAEPAISQSVVYEIKFAGYPTNTSQHDLRELEPQLLVREKLGREAGCLATALYFEARGESRLGRIAVAQVIANRARSRYFPSSICGVVWQNSHKRNRCQFSFTCDGKLDRVRNQKVWARTKSLAVAFLNGETHSQMPHAVSPSKQLDKNTRRSTHYHATYVSPGWSKKLDRMSKIGHHIFYVSARVERTMPTGV